MNKLIILGIVVFLSGCFGPTEPTYFKNTSIEMPSECSEFKDDVCGAFECMVSNCWCREVPDKILMESLGIEVSSEIKALQYFQSYIKPNQALGLSNAEFKDAVGLNTVFYNLFIEDQEGNELVYTLAVDGTLIQTVCGV
ncbi:MAG: hypothetical protein ABIA76_02595 [Candidatus Diapherotrites archaeon]